MSSVIASTFAVVRAQTSLDPRQMVEAHIQSGCGVTVAAIRVPKDEAEAMLRVAFPE